MGKVLVRDSVPASFDVQKFRVRVSFKFDDSGRLRKIIRRLEEKK